MMVCVVYFAGYSPSLMCYAPIRISKMLKMLGGMNPTSERHQLKM